MKTVRVVHLQRKPVQGAYSVERLFDAARASMPRDIAVSVRINRFQTKGVLRRFYDALAACCRGGGVKHVLGDVHYLTWFLSRRTTVLTVLDCVSLEQLSGVKRWLLWFFWYWWPAKRAARITVISDFSKEALLKWVSYPLDRIAVIPPPLSNEFSKMPVQKRVGPPRLLHIGTTSNKNLARLIEAIEGLDVTLVVIGRLDDVSKARISELRIEYENYVDLGAADLMREYQKADILVFISTYEGFGMPIIEAQAVGRPVLTSNICSMPEAAGGAACLVDPFDVADIRRGVCRLLDDPGYCQQLVERGYENAARYSPEKIAEQYAVIYRKIHEAQGVSS